MGGRARLRLYHGGQPIDRGTMRLHYTRMLFTFTTLLSLVVAAPAVAWDNTYGERTDDNSFSAVRAAVEAPGGGLYLLGWYYGEFEGLSRPDSYGVYLMKVDAEGTRKSVWDLYETSGSVVDRSFTLALGPDGQLWTAPGPGGGLARIAEGSITTELAGHHRILASTPQLMLVPKSAGAAGDASFAALDFDGNEQWSWSMQEVLADEGVDTDDVLQPSLAADANGIFVAASWIPKYPYANADAGAWRIDHDGNSVWSTNLIGDQSEVVCGNTATLTATRFLADECNGAGGFWEFDRSDGQMTERAERWARLCGADDEPVLYATTDYSLNSDPCAAGTDHVADCDLSSGDPDVRFGSAHSDRLYLNCGAYAVRWELTSDDWAADVASAPFGHHPDSGSRLWGGFETTDESLVLYGQADRTATFRTENTTPARTASGAPSTTESPTSSRTAASSHLFSAAVTNGALDVIPEAPGVHRLAGGSRYDTARTVAESRFEPAKVTTVYLTTGGNFPDALAGGPLAAQDDAPILLATRDSLPAATAAALNTLGPDEVIALGGRTAISDQVLSAAKTAAKATSTSRISGSDRYATAARIAVRVAPTNTVYLATGTNFPDALAGGAATAGSPVLLTDPTQLPQATRDAMTALAPDKVVALGGTTAVSDQVLTQAAQAAGDAKATRLAGADRYETALDIASTLSSPSTVYVSTALNFPDALAGASAAVGEAAPIMLTHPDALPAAVDSWLRAAPNLRRVVVLGGPGAISDTVMDQLAQVLVS